MHSAYTTKNGNEPHKRKVKFKLGNSNVLKNKREKGRQINRGKKIVTNNITNMSHPLINCECIY